MNKEMTAIAAIVIASSTATFVMADAAEDSVLEEMLVTGGKNPIQTLSGSAHLLTEESLEQFDFSDLNQVLSAIPGIYIRPEDGYGLRPNIGLRGVTSERSQKITLMEDGVLIKPAPYSAPAAYYIPNISRMSAIEVVKGPASIKQGPNNVGGAINLVTTPVPGQRKAFIDASVGSDGYQKHELFYGDTIDDIGYWVDLLHYSSDGFKTLDTGGDTGFERNDINAKWQWSPEKLLAYEQRFTLKLGYADEESDETYLGLTSADFDQSPYRRYAASQLDRFESEHMQIHLDHLLTVSKAFKLNTKLYWNRFERSWNKLDGFIGEPFIDLDDPGAPETSPSIRDIVNREDSDIFPRALGILRGEINSNSVEKDTLDVTNNDREYGSAGVQFKADYHFDTAHGEHQLEVGLRYHHDDIERKHFTRSYLMTNGLMVSDNQVRGYKVRNKGETDALAVFVNDTLRWEQWTANIGLRYEDIESDATDFLAATKDSKSQSIVAPGAGVFWQYSEKLGFLLGVNKGFSPAGATAGDDADPEEAINYEYGLRYQDQKSRAEIIGFFSRYKNLLGRCRASDSGCDVGEEFNGGNVEVAGVEVYGEFLLPFNVEALVFPVSLNYTYTESAFQSTFASSFSQWGDVLQGDRLPYLPEHIGRVQFGARASHWEAFMAVSYQSKMRDEASSGSIDKVLHTDAFTTVDVSASWLPHPQWLLQASVDNLFDKEAIVSWRPFGARPNKPRSARLRVKYTY